MNDKKRINESQELQPDISNLSEQLKKLRRNELIEIYKIYSQKMTNTDDITWKSASIFIPLSLSGIIIALKDLQSIIYIGFFSILLIWIWFLIAYRNSRFYRIYYKMTAAIESILIEKDPSKLFAGFNIPLPGRHRFVRHRNIIICICALITATWIIAIIIANFKT